MAWIIRTISWHRRKIAALLTALGMLALVSHLSGAAEASAHVVVTTAHVPAGAPITAADVALLALPASAIPSDALKSTDEVVGRSAAVALSPHTIVQPGLLVSGAPASTGHSLVPITVPDSQLREILSPGLRIALVAAGPEAPGVLTRDAVVHSLPSPAASSSFVSSGRAALVLVEVPSDLAADVAVLGQSGQLSVFLTG
ncbi:MAG: SAF domain-containing protein [Arachnia sp.]